MSDLEGIREFVAVVDTGSFTGAARALGLSKSVLSARVKELEKRLGVRLLHRTTRTLTLTEAGVSYHGRCKRLLSEAAAAAEALQDITGRPRGRLKISCTADFAVDHLVPLLREFTARHPDVVTDLAVSDEFVDLLKEKIDVAIRYTPLDNPSMVIRRLGKLHGFACASPDYVERHGFVRHPDELAERDCLIFTPYPWGLEWRFVDPSGTRRRVTVRDRAWISNGHVLREATLAGAGISLLATTLCGEAIRCGRLVNVMPGWAPDVDETTERVICAVYPDNKWIPAKVKAFVDFLTERVGNPPYWDIGLPDDFGRPATEEPHTPMQDPSATASARSR